MAEIRPLRAVRYEPSAVGSLDAVAAPPYDVIDDALRAELAARGRERAREFSWERTARSTLAALERVA